jgi:hypothetical protein
MQSKFLYQVSARRMTLAAAERWAERRGLRIATTKEIGILYHGGKIPLIKRKSVVMACGGFWTDTIYPKGCYVYYPAMGRQVGCRFNELNRVVAVSI